MSRQLVDYFSRHSSSPFRYRRYNIYTQSQRAPLGSRAPLGKCPGCPYGRSGLARRYVKQQQPPSEQPTRWKWQIFGSCNEAGLLGSFGEWLYRYTKIMLKNMFPPPRHYLARAPSLHLGLSAAKDNCDLLKEYTNNSGTLLFARQEYFTDG